MIVEAEEKYFHEDDELTDEEYFVDERPNVIKEEIIEDEEENALPDDEDEDSEESEEAIEREAREVFGDDDGFQPEEDTAMMPTAWNKKSRTYKPSGFSNAFLRCECDIKLESYKTVCVFEYNGELYSGIVLKKLNKDEYIFEVESYPVNKKDKNAKSLKKIYIPDTSFISGKPAGK